MTVHGHVCSPRTYAYGGWHFEYGYCGPWPLKANGDIRLRCGRKFLADIEGFFALSEANRELYRVGGGCVSF